MTDAGAPSLLWLIDDAADNHAVVEATVDRLGGWVLAGFLTGEEAIDDYRRSAHRRAGLPGVVLMDYFLGSMRGDQVTVELRRAEPPGHRPVIVGYSSVRSGSERIVSAGGDVIVRKHRDPRGINPSLLTFLSRWVHH